MKKIINCLIFVIIIFFGCKQDNVTSPSENLKAAGKVSINIDKISAPTNVTFIMVTLTKVNSDTLTGFMNLSTDTTAAISFQNIAVGTWNLTVVAENISGTVLYQGQSSITVSQGTTTNVSLTLNPVLNGTGTVSISVKWGTSQPYFTDYSYYPVYTGKDNYSGQIYVSEAKILYDNGICKIWYIGVYNSGGGKTWYAESTDGINWANKYVTPALTAGTSGSWDDLFASVGTVIKDNGIYKMYYDGGRVGYGNYYVGLATSIDGVNWQKYPSPVFAHDSSSQYYIGVQSILKINSTYFMYYSAAPQSNYNQFSINLAVSSDGVNWTKYQNNPILSATLPWEGSGIAYPAVIYDGNQYIMVYHNSIRSGFGIAYSPDGIHWTKKYKNPVFTVANSKMGNTIIEYPYLIKVNGEYRIYYTASIGDNMTGIFMARTNSIQ